jgi:uncharacterized protein (TIGR03437 family)
VRSLVTWAVAATATASFGQSGFYQIGSAAGSDWVGDGGVAISAILLQAEGLAADASGNVYVADASDHRVRRISPGGVIQTVAGTGIPGFSGDGGAAVAAQLNAPYGLALDKNGNLYIADLGNARVRKIAPDGTITTVAGAGTLAPGGANDGAPAVSISLNAPRNVAADSSGNLYISDFNAHRVYRLSPGGALTTVAGTGVPGFSGDGGSASQAKLGFPAGLALDGQGSLYIGDTQNHLVRKVTRGVITSYAYATAATGLAFDASGKLYVADATAGQILIAPPSGAATALGAAAHDIAFANGYCYASAGSTVLKIAPGGTILLAAGGGDPAHGDGSPAMQARLNHPSGTALDSAGNLYIADRDNHRVRRVSPDGTIATVAGTGFAGSAGDGGLAALAQLNSPSSVAVDSSGNLYIADTGNARVRVVTPGGRIYSRTQLGLLSPVYAIPDSAGNIYVADEAQGKILKAGGNGVPATLLTGLKSPHGLALDSQGDLYFTEAGAARVRRLAADGTVTSIADGVWNAPRGIAVDSSGRIFVADSGLQRVFAIDPSGHVAAIAGTGALGFSGDGGPAGLAQFSYPWDVALGPSTGIAIADLGNNRIRMLAPFAQASVSATPLADAVNAASLLPGPIAPSSLVLLRNTGVQADIQASRAPGVQVSLGSAAAQIVSTSASGILILTPSQIANVSEIDAFYGGIQIAAIPITVRDSAPALFADASGQAAAINEDGTLNSAAHPAPRGSIISLYGTGLGVSPPPVTATIGNYLADVLYAGPVAAYPGLFQINVRIPAGYLGPGDLSVVGGRHFHGASGRGDLGELSATPRSPHARTKVSWCFRAKPRHNLQSSTW